MERVATLGGMVRSLLPLALAALVLSGCAGGSGADNEPSDGTTTADVDSAPAAELNATDLATDLTSPWGLVTLGDGSVLVSERDTTDIVHVLSDGTSEVVATIEEARPAGEAGLLGLIATPDESTVFAYYTAENDNRIVSMTWDGTTLGAPDVIFDGIPIGDGNRHEGGGLELGPDDLLYVGTGETGVSPELAQDRESLGGKILRLTQDGDAAPGNPFDSAVYTWGHRNVEGLAFDDQGRLWASEFGDSRWDELNLIEAGNNYGWPEVEGSGGGDDYVDPVAVWRTEDASPAGLGFWDGSLWMAGLRGATLWEIPLDDAAEGPGAGEPVAHLTGEYGRLRNVEPTADGSALVLATSNTDGRGDPDPGDDRLLSLTR
ncbi:PQQ-dependent sugar dehydrogenase [Nocardioides salsibiostraticola]